MSLTLPGFARLPLPADVLHSFTRSLAHEASEAIKRPAGIVRVGARSASVPAQYSLARLDLEEKGIRMTTDP